MPKKKNIVLDDFENEILEAYEDGKLKPSKSQTEFQAIAQNTMKKNKKINIRISENDRSVIFVTPNSFAVAGISCIKPLAPTQDFLLGLNSDS